MSESTVEFLRRQLRLAGARQWPKIAERTGMSANTLRKMAYGDRKNPRIDTIEPLMRYFRANESEEARDAA
jgi:transcriptional regulator with XRE-family HTH domain